MGASGSNPNKQIMWAHVAVVAVRGGNLKAGDHPPTWHGVNNITSTCHLIGKHRLHR